MMRCILPLALLAFFVLTPLTAEAEMSQDEVFAVMKEQLDRQPVLRANFRQERHLQVLKRPLLSTGRMTLRNAEGILWRVADPYAVTYLIRPGEVLEWEGDGAPQRIAMGAVPAFRLMTEMFMAALAGDTAALQEGFQAEPLPASSGWRLRLRPKSTDLAGLIAGLEVSGNRFVEEVHLQEVKGDSVSFYFSDFATEPVELDADEKAFFAQ